VRAIYLIRHGEKPADPPKDKPDEQTSDPSAAPRVDEPFPVDPKAATRTDEWRGPPLQI